MSKYKEIFSQHKVLFATNGDLVPNSPLLDSIFTYYDVLTDNLLCIPGKDISTNKPIFGLQAFYLILSYAINHSYDYIIYIDADCFIWSLNNLGIKFNEFIERNYIIAGVPDGGIFCHRNSNCYCINPFLAFFNIKLIKNHILNGNLILANPHSENDISLGNVNACSNVLLDCDVWRKKFQPIVPYMYSEDFKRSNDINSAYTSKFSLMDEYYYKLFLGFQYSNELFMYMHGRDYICDADPLGLTSGLYINANMEDDNNLICLHTWFSRLLINPNSSDPVLNCTCLIDHRSRIHNIIDFVKHHQHYEL